MRKVDNLGRIVIPKELRRKYGLIDGANISFEDSGDGILVRPSEGLCRICGTHLPSDTKIPLCFECVRKVIREYKAD